MAKEETNKKVNTVTTSDKGNNKSFSLIIKGVAKKLFPLTFTKVYFEGHFISERRYLNILAKRYFNMLKSIKEGQEYPTWE